jgi:predicted  nucleic acid-binding Zn-ribbon protein
MEHQISRIALLAAIDEQIDELNEEFGDLPQQADHMKVKAEDTKKQLDETQQIIKDIEEFVSKARTTLVELKQREDKLKQQQFNVQNNKEFDSITNEIAYIKREHSKLSEQMRKEALKLENLKAIEEKQAEDMQATDKEYKDKIMEIKNISEEQQAEIISLKEKKEKVLTTIDERHLHTYNRARTMFSDAAVAITRTSCSGCFNMLPAQQMVDVRNNPDLVYTCENCGRILLPEDCKISDEDIDKI